MSVIIRGRKRVYISLGCYDEVCAEVKAATEKEAKKLWEQELERQERELLKAIREKQKTCEHEFEEVWSEINKCNFLVCRKCCYSPPKSAIFNDDFLQAYRKGLTSVPRPP